MLKIYTDKPIPNTPLVLDYAARPVVEIVSEPDNADYFLLPHNWTHVQYDDGYLKYFFNLADKLKKQVIIFWFGDSSKQFWKTDDIIFRTSQYKSVIKHNEVIMPTVVEDLGAKYGITTRDKQAIPSIGFAGWAKQSGRAAFKTRLKNIFLSGPRKKGIYFREKAINALLHSPVVKTNFILRDQYKSGSQEEFAKNIKASDFTLAPKGDGNYSARFYEVLSLGRLPILIDTDCALPLEDEVDYGKFVVRVPYNELETLPQRVSDFYSKMSGQNYTQAQQFARAAFEKYLNITSYLEHVLSKEFLSKYE